MPSQFPFIWAKVLSTVLDNQLQCRAYHPPWRKPWTQGTLWPTQSIISICSTNNILNTVQPVDVENMRIRPWQPQLESGQLFNLGKPKLRITKKRIYSHQMMSFSKKNRKFFNVIFVPMLILNNNFLVIIRCFWWAPLVDIISMLNDCISLLFQHTGEVLN